jgi:hypothetical protein
MPNIETCHGRDCTNKAIFAVGKLLLCDKCVETQQQSHPNSFRRYWEPKIRSVIKE